MAVLLIIGCLLLSFIPCLLLYFWLKKGMEDQERQDLCRTLLKSGVLCSLGVFVCSGALVALKQILGFTIVPALATNDLLGAVYQDFLVYAFSEELVKGLTA